MIKNKKTTSLAFYILVLCVILIFIPIYLGKNEVVKEDFSLLNFYKKNNDLEKKIAQTKFFLDSLNEFYYLEKAIKEEIQHHKDDLDFIDIENKRSCILDENFYIYNIKILEAGNHEDQKICFKESNFDFEKKNLEKKISEELNKIFQNQKITSKIEDDKIKILINEDFSSKNLEYEISNLVIEEDFKISSIENVLSYLINIINCFEKKDFSNCDLYFKDKLFLVEISQKDGKITISNKENDNQNFNLYFII